MAYILYVGIGGFIGSVGRYLLGLGLESFIAPALRFPLPTLIVNIVGSFLIGIFLRNFDTLNPEYLALRLFVVTGILGGFTTFSAFSWETLALIRQGSMFLALSNICANVVLSLLAVMSGAALCAAED